jgi:HAD superfamily hydrolase (TIGR01450 family)
VNAYDAYILDIDGTVSRGDELIPTAAETIQALRALERRVLFVSNDASRSEEAHAARLTDLGVVTAPEDVLTPTPVLVELLSERVPGARVLVIGRESVSDALAAAGFERAAAPTTTDAVVVSHDRSFDYASLAAARSAIAAGARLFATNADRVRPTADGFEPGTGAILAAVERCSRTRAEAVAGKPSGHMLKALRKRAGAEVDRCLMVGDQLDIDIRMASGGGMDSALVLTGVTDREQLGPATVHPTYVIVRLADLLPDDHLTSSGRRDPIRSRTT